MITRDRHDLTARELKIMDFVISKIQPTDSDFTTIHTNINKLTNVLNLKKVVLHIVIYLKILKKKKKKKS